MKKNAKVVLISMALLVIGFIPFMRHAWSYIQQIAFDQVVRRTQLEFWQSDVRKQLMHDELSLRIKDAQLARLEFVERENETLRSEFASSAATKRQWIPTHLIHTDAGIFIDVGSVAGVQENAIVMVQGQYIGIVRHADAYISQVQTLDARDIRVGVRAGREHTLAVLSRDDQGLLMTCISRTDGIQVGDRVETETGLLIGYVARVRTQPADSVSLFVVQPAVDLTKFQLVFVNKSIQ